MSYYKDMTWEIIPKNMPIVKRNCPKCGNNSLYISTNKFRINGNKKLLDIWLIYQCKKCKSTWKMAIYERVYYKDLDKVMFSKFEQNNIDLARYYAFNKEVHNKNKSILITEGIRYEIQGDMIETNKEVDCKKVIRIQIKCEYELGLRVDKLLSDKLGISRSQIKKLCKEGLIYCDEDIKITKQKVKNGMILYLVI
ncbi:DUF1062 domain-containing protein [Clostridiaceae bacterium M8S5]|nr:DUF1062 domain-containing protein [Clostridiaceae bacterium M8S5]